MKIAFLVLIFCHALIHLLGFIKAYQIINVKFAQSISKSHGKIWLVSFVLFVITIVLFATNNMYWWIVAFITVIISQILIIHFWRDAKFGTIINVIILFATIIGCSTWSFNNKYLKDVENGLHQEVYFSNSLLTEVDMLHLPEVVKKYLYFSGSVGKQKVNNFKVKFIGKLRQNEQSQWMEFTSVQFNFMQTPTRLFFMNAEMNSLPVVGYHCFENGNASMDIRLFSLFQVQYQEGVEMNVSETVTFFNDMCCLAPSTLIDKRINWLEVDSAKVKASFTNNHITVNAWLYFNDQGQLINFISNDRYSADAQKRLPWKTPIKEYQEIDGYKLMKYAETIYSYPNDDFCYGTFNLTKVEYNCK